MTELRLVDVPTIPANPHDHARVDKRPLTVVCLNRGLSSLFTAKDQIDPFMKVLRHVLAFQRFSVYTDELGWTGCPRGKLDISNLDKDRTKSAYLLDHNQRDT